MASRYWRGGSGLWSDTSHWSTTSGGSGGASVPSQFDDVFIDNNAGSGTIYIGLSTTLRQAGSLTITRTSSTYLSESSTTANRGDSGLSTYGDITFSADSSVYMELQYFNSYGLVELDFKSGPTLSKTRAYALDIQGTATIISDIAVSNISVNGTLRVGANCSISNVTLNSSGAVFDTKDYDVVFGQYGVYVFYSGTTVDLGASKVTFGSLTTNKSGFGDFAYPDFTAGSFSAQDADIVIYTGSKISSTAAVVYNFGFSDIGSLTIKRYSSSYTNLDIAGSPTIGTLTIDPGTSVRFNTDKQSPPYVSVSSFVANGTAALPITLRATTLGKQFILSKSSGTVNASYIDLKDSVASGGATWNAIGGTNSGNNSGWNFLPPPLPTWGFIDSTATVYAPTLTPGTATMSPSFINSAAVVYSASNTMYLSGGTFIDSTAAVYPPVLTQLPPPPPPPTDWEAIGKEDEKVYVYKVYSSTGTFIGIWTDVKDDLEFSQRINTPGTTTTVRLNRSPNTTKEVRANLTTEAGEPITTEDGERLSVTYETSNSVGEGTDVDINYNVDVYVHYGEFARLITEDGGSLLTESGDHLLAAVGAPSGVRVFSGYILDYELLYGESTGVTITLASHGAELSNALVRSGENIIVTYSNTAIEATLKSVLNTNPQKMTYSSESIQNTGVSVTTKFQLNTKLEAIESLHDQTPDGWFWYGNVADNNVYLQATAATAHHTFEIGYHVKNLALRRSAEQLRNRVYFVGAEVSGVSILKKYEDTTSQTNWRVGLHRITDRRYSVTDSISRKANKEINRYKNPIYTTTVTISSARYDLESIKLGQVVRFSNAENDEVKALLLQIVNLSYTPTAATLELGEVLQAQHERIEELNDGLQGEQYQTLPTAPS